ncbi:MAG: DNA-3-methyladenine glycosylase [Leptolyngbyaceae cyanobacterium]
MVDSFSSSGDPIRLDPIPIDWYSRPATEVAPDLIGCTLVRQMPDGAQLRGLIVETEAYGPDDPACHAYRRKTARNRVMFGPAGRTYVYLIYGIYYCLNVITDLDGLPSAVLLRALHLETAPDWIDRDKQSALHRIAAGPGKLCRAFKVDTGLNGYTLEAGQPLWLEHRSPQFTQTLAQQKIKLTQTTRIGLTQGVDLPWRWYLADCLSVSKP